MIKINNVEEIRIDKVSEDEEFLKEINDRNLSISCTFSSVNQEQIGNTLITISGQGQYVKFLTRSKIPTGLESPIENYSYNPVLKELDIN